MQYVTALIMLIFLGMSFFIPLSLHVVNEREAQKTKQILNLSSKALVTSFEDSIENYDILGQGYLLDERDVIGVDQERLINEFNDILRKNCINEGQYHDIRQKVVLKVLCYYDRFFVSIPAKELKTGATAPYEINDFKITDRWLPPFFYTIVDDQQRLIYLNTQNNNTRYYNNGWVDTAVTNIQVDGKALTVEDKYDAIIKKVNQVISTYTLNPRNHVLSGNKVVYINPGMDIKIQNQERANPDKAFKKINTPGVTQEEIDRIVSYQISHGDFNILDGITLFVVFTDDKEFTFADTFYSFRNYQMAGHTFEP